MTLKRRDDVGGRGAIRRLLTWPRRDRARIRAEVDDEIAFHLEMRVRELIEQGRSLDGARAQAEREFGNVAEAREDLMASDMREYRKQRWSDAIGDALRDVRLTVRGLARAPLFTAAAVSTLGLGIGANTALFTLVDGVVLKPLPYADAEELAAVPSDMFMRGEFVALRERARSYEQLAGYGLEWNVGIATTDEPVQVKATLTSANLMETLGVAPAFGRGFGPEHEQPGSDPVVMLAHGLATELFGEASRAVGESIVVNGLPSTVIGVMPSWFAFPTSQTRVWRPFIFDPTDVNTHWGGYWVWLVGRLRPGITSEQARQELVMLMAQLRLENPRWTPPAPYRADVLVEPLVDRIVGDADTPLLLLLGATAFVLLIACANVGNLFAVRIASRDRDFAVRAALGGGPKHILRTVMLEGLVLAAFGGALGIVLAYAGLRAALPFLPADTPRLEQVAIDGRVLGFAVLATLVAASLFSLLPAARVLGARLHGALQEGGRGAGESRRMRRVSRAVVVGEVALAVVLLLGATLLFRSLAVLYAIDPGFRTEGVTAARVTAAGRQLPDSAARRSFYGRILERVAAAPGVHTAAVTSQLPFDGALSQTVVAVEDVRMDPNDLPVFDYRPISPDYFRVLDMPVLEGRAFTTADQQGSLPVAIVDEITAQRFWPGASPIGRRVGWTWSDEWLTVVGIVPTAKNGDLTSEPLPALYVPFAQRPAMTSATIVVRSDRPAGALAPIIRSAVREAHPDVPVADVHALDALVRDSVSDARAVTWLLTAFAGVALLLGALGIYGVLAFSVQRRAREIGVRLALGAQPSEVRALVLRDGALLISFGVAVGIPVALLLGRGLQGLLYGVGTTDPVSLITAPAMLAAAGLLAAFLPALRASRVDPATTLRSE